MFTCSLNSQERLFNVIPYKLILNANFQIQMVNQNGKMVVLISPMDNQAQQLENSSETSPLNQRLRDNNSDISSSPSSAVTITTNEQSTKQLLHSGISHQSIKLLLKIIIDVGILCIGESSSFSCINLKAIKISFCRKV